MKLETGTQDTFNNITVRVPTPEGTLFVAILEDADSKPVAVQLTLGKAGTVMAAWSQALARMITCCLERGATIEDLITELSSITSDHYRNGTNGEAVRSGPEGVYVALMKYRREKYDELAKNLGIKADDNRRGPSLGRKQG